MTEGASSCNGLLKDAGCKDNHPLGKNEEVLSPAVRAEPTGLLPADPIRSKVIRASKNVRVDGGETEVLSQVNRGKE